MEQREWKNLTLDIPEIYRRIGMPDADSERSRSFRSVIEKVRLQALEFIDARCIFAYFPVKISGREEILLDNRFPVKAAGSFFEGAEEVMVAVQTIGPQLLEESARLFQDGEMLEGMILDGCGTVAVDEVLELIRGLAIERASGQGLQTGYNLCPGGRQVPLEVQKTIFQLLDGSQIGVTLTETLLMSPVKSHSLMIPLGRCLSKPNSSCAITCEMCSGQYTCPHSRLKFQKTGESAVPEED
ncbi:vitamin B12 dependent methionine synthase [Desulfosporosinus sp. PR]|uniref:vitamin B12 dependent methionine synthase n=1 Tax=Candidatus Desulfosporosinus nitrosoreducens TaxID=3401928 RepID=UPI0027E8BC2B|nr:vitamin B12 dependent methionine synthase [Desulfosporosinus sp. PR]MDQ7096338.1 vitamin B12 dependent methionine synthase [Desulfosporosinus sp. PR]